MRLVEALGTIRLRSDIERKRLFGEQTDASKDQLAKGIYSAEASQATYDRLHQLARETLLAGFPVVIDATYLKAGQRQAASEVAEQTGAPFLILDCHAPEAVIASWLAQRQQDGKDPSDATLEVIQAQQAAREPLDDEEVIHSKRVDTHDSASLDSLVERIRQRLPGI
jgi:predicted kinase